jgi:hypothetical protein
MWLPAPFLSASYVPVTGTYARRLIRTRMNNSPDVWRAAKLLVAQHGDRAAEHVGRRIFELIQEDDAAGVAKWTDILDAIVAIRAQKRPAGSSPR